MFLLYCNKNLPKSPKYKCYLKKLKQICKLIIFCNDNELSNKELSKLKGIVDYTIIGRHNEYDFGSYKRGIQLLESLPNYNSYEDLILCNDSCYGPHK